MSHRQVDEKSVKRQYNHIFYDTSAIEVKVRETHNLIADICEAAQADVFWESCSSTDGGCRTQGWLSQRTSSDMSALLGLIYKERKYSQNLVCAQDSLEVSLSNSSFSFSWVWTTYPVWSVVEVGFGKVSVRKNLASSSPVQSRSQEWGLQCEGGWGRSVFSCSGYVFCLFS